jgi:hypothetical protein
MNNIGPSILALEGVLIYMSIGEEIRKRKAEGELHVLAPLMPGAPHKRVILASTWLFKELSGPWEDEAEEVRMGRLWADLDHFSTGEQIIVGSRFDDYCHMKPLDPASDEVWEYISRCPKPSLRVFGRFAEIDVFVATHKWARNELGAFRSREWKREIRRCKAEWTRIFPAHYPVVGVSANDYVSENIINRCSL